MAKGISAATPTTNSSSLPLCRQRACFLRASLDPVVSADACRDTEPVSDGVERCAAVFVAAGEQREMDSDAREALTALIASARAAYPEVDVDSQAFAAHLGRHVGGEPSALATVQGASLYLAFSCGLGDAKAIATFRAQFGSDIDRALAKAQSTGIGQDELRQSVEVKLFAGGKDGAPHILKYSGRGSLQGWVRVVVTRMVIDRLRSHAAEETPVELSVADALGDHGLDPALQLLRARYRDDVHAAIEDAFAQLTSKERRLLRGAVVQGLATDDLGALFGVHRTTAARWVDKAQQRLLELTHTQLGDRLGSEDETVRGLVALVRSQLDVSVARLLESVTSVIDG